MTTGIEAPFHRGQGTLHTAHRAAGPQAIADAVPQGVRIVIRQQTCQTPLQAPFLAHGGAQFRIGGEAAGHDLLSGRIHEAIAQAIDDAGGLVHDRSSRHCFNPCRMRNRATPRASVVRRKRRAISARDRPSR